MAEPRSAIEVGEDDDRGSIFAFIEAMRGGF